MDDIYDYLKEKFLPEDDATAEWIARQSKRYAMVDGDLYRCDTDGVFLRCMTREEGGELLADIHEGEYRSHSSSCTLVGKAFRQGFYWPTALQDAAELVKCCKACLLLSPTSVTTGKIAMTPADANWGGRYFMNHE